MDSKKKMRALGQYNKYEQIVKDIGKIFNKEAGNILIESTFNAIKDKYFPKMINRVIEVDVSASNQEVINELAEDISNMANSQSHRKGKIRVINLRWDRN